LCHLNSTFTIFCYTLCTHTRLKQKSSIFHELSHLFKISICREIYAYWILNSQLYVYIFLNCYLTSYQLFIHACSEKLFLWNFFSKFSFLVWCVRTDLAWSPNACGPANRWSGSSHPDACPTGIKFAFSCLFVVLCVFLVISHEFSTFHILFCTLSSHSRYFFCSSYSVIYF